MRGKSPKLAFIVGSLLALGGPAIAKSQVDWDQIANIKEAAVRLANVQKKQGATKAFNFIIACYKTQGMSTKFTRYFEGCIAQDYIHTQTLAAIYSRMPPDTLKKMGAPSPQAMSQAMGQRVAGAFSKYQIPPADAVEFQKLIEKYGFQPFAEIVFPHMTPAEQGKEKDNGKKKTAP